MKEWSVKNFGAVGDGRTDDSRAFERCAASAAAYGGGTVLAPRGLYLCSSLPTLPADVPMTLAGEGRGNPQELERPAGTAILYTGADENALLVTPREGSQPQGVTLRDFTLAGGTYSALRSWHTHVAGNGNGIALHRAHHSIISNVMVMGFDGCGLVTMKDGGAPDGGDLQTQSYYLTIQHSKFVCNRTAGADFTGIGTSLVSRCDFSNNYVGAINPRSLTGYCGIEANLYDGILLRSSNVEKQVNYCRIIDARFEQNCLAQRLEWTLNPKVALAADVRSEDPHAQLEIGGITSFGETYKASRYAGTNRIIDGVFFSAELHGAVHLFAQDDTAPAQFNVNTTGQRFLDFTGLRFSADPSRFEPGSTPALGMVAA